jgi:nitrogen-specific signal transduction histidine kinase/CheY-like chemotaxis protein
MPLKVTGVLQDITERKQAQEALRQAQKLDLIGQLSGGIAHDMNNLLGPILGYADLLLKSLEPGDQRRADIEEIVKAADRATGLVRQLLAFSRRQVLESRVVKLNDIVSEMGGMLQRVISERPRLKLELSDNTGLVKVDPAQIEHALMNLALNARDAMPAGGDIIIETYGLEAVLPVPAAGGTVVPGKYAVLSVKDAGCGMDEATKSKIFEPFFTTKARGKGMGLGLSSVYGIVKQSGGEILVESFPGKGSVFKIYLPVSNERAAGKSAWLQAQIVGKGVVLLAEDDEPMRRITRRILEGAGYSVVEAVNGVEALKLLNSAREPVALLLTDVAMPEMDGIELSMEVIKKWPGIRILCMSGYVGKEDEFHNALGTKADFIQKPFNPDTLMRKVSEVLSRGK